MKRIILLLLALAATLCIVSPASAEKTLYADTLSLWGRTSDSTSVQAVSGRTTVTLAFRVAGVVTAGIQRYAVSIRWYYGVASDDTTYRVTATPFPALTSSTKPFWNGTVAVDSLSQKDDATATAAATQYELLLGLLGSIVATTKSQQGPWSALTIAVPERVSGYSIKFRLLSQSTAKPTGAATAGPGYHRLTIVRM